MKDWVVVKTFSGPVIGEMAKELLERNDIPSILQKDFFSAAYNIAGTAMGPKETRLLVPEDQLEASRDILTAIDDDG